MAKILQINAREILDSRGNPTVEVDLRTEEGVFRAAVPSGASTGIYEAHEKRDGDKSRYLGKGVKEAIKSIHEIIAPKLCNMNVTEQEKIDKIMVEELDGSKNDYGFSKSKLGANAILAISMAVCRAGAAHRKMPLYKYIMSLVNNGDIPSEKMILPVPAFNVINGGSHAGNALAMQEFMILPVGAKSFPEALRMGTETYHHLRNVVKEKYGINSTNVGDEGGFAPPINDHFEALELIMTAIKKAGYEHQIKIGMDVAASEFFKDNMYNLNFKSDTEKLVSGDELIAIYKDIIEKYPVISIEDPFDQDDFTSYEKFTREVGSKIQIVGDDLLVTNPVRIQMGLDKKLCNALLLKINQIGTISESINACKLARKHEWGVMVSHRSGETEDTFIADLVVGLSTGQIKSGAPCRSERLAKYNQLLRIDAELSTKSLNVYAGNDFPNPKL